MNKDTKNWYMLHLANYVLNNSVNFFADNYFQLYHWQQVKLGEIAELFGIKPSKKGWSRAQTLFQRLKKYEDSQLPF